VALLVHLDNLIDIAYINYDKMYSMIDKYKMIGKTHQRKLDYKTDQYNKNISTYLVVLEHNLSTIIESMNTFSALLDDYKPYFIEDYFT
jgi:hypothetical protein